MSNILKVTTPPTGYDNNAINKQTTSQQAENMSVKNPVDPSRVVRADGRNQANNQQDAAQNVGGPVDVEIQPGEGNQHRQNQRRLPERVSSSFQRKHRSEGGGGVSRGKGGIPRRRR